MAKRELENLRTHELRKKKRFASFLLGILVGLVLVNIFVSIAARRPDLLAVAAALLVVGLPMFLGLKKVNAELDRREGGYGVEGGNRTQ